MQRAVPKPTKTAAITKALPQGDAESWLNWHFELEKREKSTGARAGKWKIPIQGAWSAPPPLTPCPMLATAGDSWSITSWLLESVGHRGCNKASRAGFSGLLPRLEQSGLQGVPHAKGCASRRWELQTCWGSLVTPDFSSSTAIHLLSLFPPSVRKGFCSFPFFVLKLCRLGLRKKRKRKEEGDP